MLFDVFLTWTWIGKSCLGGSSDAISFIRDSFLVSRVIFMAVDDILGYLWDLGNRLTPEPLCRHILHVERFHTTFSKQPPEILPNPAHLLDLPRNPRLRPDHPLPHFNCRRTPRRRRTRSLGKKRSRGTSGIRRIRFLQRNTGDFR